MDFQGAVQFFNSELLPQRVASNSNLQMLLREATASSTASSTNLEPPPASNDPTIRHGLTSTDGYGSGQSVLVAANHPSPVPNKEKQYVGEPPVHRPESSLNEEPPGLGEPPIHSPNPTISPASGDDSMQDEPSTENGGVIFGPVAVAQSVQTAAALEEHRPLTPSSEHPKNAVSFSREANEVH